MEDEQKYLWEMLEDIWPTEGKIQQTLIEELEEIEVKRIKLALDQAN